MFNFCKPRNAVKPSTENTNSSISGLSERFIPLPSGYKIFLYGSVNLVEDCFSKNRSSIKELVFFIHGVGGCAKIWSQLLNHFNKQGIAVLAFDFLGHGKSDSPTEKSCYKFKNLRSDVLYLFDYFCCSAASVVVVAHSYGCSFAAYLATERSKTIQAMVLIAPGEPAPLYRTSWSLFRCPTCCCSPFLGCIVRPFLFFRFKKSCCSHSRYQTTEIPMDFAFTTSPYVFKNVMLGQSWPEGGLTYYERIQTPSLVIHAENDSLITYEDNQRTSEAMTNATLKVIKCCGHMAMMERPVVLEQLTDEFLKSIEFSCGGRRPVDTADGSCPVGTSDVATASASSH